MDPKHQDRVKVRRPPADARSSQHRKSCAIADDAQQRAAGIRDDADGLRDIHPTKTVPAAISHQHGVLPRCALPRKDRRWARAWSPEQIARRLPIDFPDDKTMRISHEAIYQALFVQGRGALRRELSACLRTGRVLRVPRM